MTDCECWVWAFVCNSCIFFFFIWDDVCHLWCLWVYHHHVWDLLRSRSLSRYIIFSWSLNTYARIILICISHKFLGIHWEICVPAATWMTTIWLEFHLLPSAIWTSLPTCKQHGWLCIADILCTLHSFALFILFFFISEMYEVAGICIPTTSGPYHLMYSRELERFNTCECAQVVHNSIHDNAIYGCSCRCVSSKHDLYTDITTKQGILGVHKGENEILLRNFKNAGHFDMELFTYTLMLFGQEPCCELYGIAAWKSLWKSPESDYTVRHSQSNEPHCVYVCIACSQHLEMPKTSFFCTVSWRTKYWQFSCLFQLHAVQRVCFLACWNLLKPQITWRTVSNQLDYLCIAKNGQIRKFKCEGQPISFLIITQWSRFLACTLRLLHFKTTLLSYVLTGRLCEIQPLCFVFHWYFMGALSSLCFEV